jgi:hypothetical protein
VDDGFDHGGFTVRQSVRCVALGLLSAVAVASAALPASAGLLDGGWGCGCGRPAYYVVPDYIAPAYVEPLPALIYPQVQVVVGPPVVYAPPYAYAPARPWRHRYGPRRYY